MSKSKKNTVDPEVMIKRFGADAVRWFILSDSPPEKDIQWSDTGVLQYKFLQKVWDLNYEIVSRSEGKINTLENDKFFKKINSNINKIDSSINNFRFNVAIAQFYEVQKYFKNNLQNEISNDCLKINILNIMKLMIPFTPHLSKNV